MERNGQHGNFVVSHAYNQPTTGGHPFHFSWGGTPVQLTSGTFTMTTVTGFEQNLSAYDFQGCDADSIARYGTRPRETPLLLAIQRTTPPPADYAPPADLVSDAINGELARYANPTPVVAVSLDTGTTARRDDLMDRRIGQKVHITADGQSQLGHDADFFVEAQEVRISPTGELASTIWCVEAPPPEAPTDAPTGFTVTRNSASRQPWHGIPEQSAQPGSTSTGATRANSLTLLAGDVGSDATVEYIDNTISSPNEYWYAVAAENNGGEGPQTAAMRAGWPQQPTDFRYSVWITVAVAILGQPERCGHHGLSGLARHVGQQHQHRDRKQRGECQHHAIHRCGLEQQSAILVPNPGSVRHDCQRPVGCGQRDPVIDCGHQRAGRERSDRASLQAGG